MYLKGLMLRKKLTELQAQKSGLEERKKALKKREDDAAKAIEELTPDSTEEEKSAVQEEVDAIEEEKTKLDADESDLTQKINDTEQEIAKNDESAPAPAADEEPAPTDDNTRAKEKIKVKRDQFFGLDYNERTAFFADEEVKKFLGDVRTHIQEKRDFTNVGLTIPQNFLPLIKQIVGETSKLYSAVRSISLKGTGREVIMGSYPEAVWTEACGKLNELTLGFNDVEVDGYKVGGYFEICNATLEDNDVNLASELITAVGKGIGKAVDKAILYGTGTKMPMGVVTRLAQTAKPASYSATARAWKDLHTSNITKIAANTSGKNLFKEIIKLRSIIKNDYSTNGLIWVMNSKTHTKLIAESLDALTAPTIIAGMTDTMPIIGGRIIELDDVMADDDIVYGYFENYLLAQRAGVKLSSSEHYKFIEDRTIVKGTARYDGTPVIAEAFGVVNINNTAPATSKTFAADSANTVTTQPTE